MAGHPITPPPARPAGRIIHRPLRIVVLLAMSHHCAAAVDHWGPLGQVVNTGPH